MRLIDADALHETIEKGIHENPHDDPKVRACHAHEHRHFLVEIARQPTADVEQVVYCKDCACVRAVHTGNKFVYRCPMSTVDVEPEGYCSRGVRRNEDMGRS